MANFVYTPAKAKLLKGEIDFDVDDIRVLLVDNTTTADTEQDTEFLSGFTTLGELSGTGYVRKALTGEVVNQDNTNNRGEFDADDVTWSAINAGTIAGAIVYKHVGADSANIAIAFIDSIFPYVTDGGDVTLQWNGEGILQLT